MNRSSGIMASILLAFSSAVVLAQAPTPQPAPAADHKTSRQIVTTYFHGDVRCYTCKKIEADARAAIEHAFPAELADGRVVFKSVNVDRPENAHFNQDYSLVTRSLVITEEVEGKVVRWVNLEKIWQLVRDEAAYYHYVVDGVRTYLDGQA